MSPQKLHHHVVVDGSNVATEGRNLPSLAQLDEAVRAFLADHPSEKLTVVVDATFGHRIEAGERAAYEEAILAGELVCPPAGAIGRGDAFVLQIADKAGAVIFSNDSFQEFHGDYPWLFDEGRLIGGKPVPEVGWVFVPRTPVRGPVSRRATKDARPLRANRPARSQAKEPSLSPKARTASPKTSTAVPKGHGDDHGNGADDTNGADHGNGGGRRSTRRRGGARVEPVNEPLPYIEFVGAHPVGSTIEAVVERFSSHGAYVKVGDIDGYVPLKLLGDPPPRSAREVLAMGETRAFVVTAFDPPRRSVDLVPADVTLTRSEPEQPEQMPAAAEEAEGPVGVEPAAQVAKAAAKKAKAAAKKAVKKTTSAISTAKKPSKAPAKKTPAAEAPAKKAAAKKTAAKKAEAKTAQAPSSSAKESAAKKSAVKKAPVKKTTAEAQAQKTTAKKTVAKKAEAKKTQAKKTQAKKTQAPSPAAKKSAVKKAPAKKAPSKRAQPKDSATKDS